jgi:hypothetical protein
MKISRSSLVLAILLAALPIAVRAQFETATVLGTVRDGTGAVIVGSKVTLENVKTGVVSTTQSNDSGNFDFIAVQIGTYRLKAEAPGFKVGLGSDFTVAVSARQRVAAHRHRCPRFQPAVRPGQLQRPIQRAGGRILEQHLLRCPAACPSI